MLLPIFPSLENKPAMSEIRFRKDKITKYVFFHVQIKSMKGNKEKESVYYESSL